MFLEVAKARFLEASQRFKAGLKRKHLSLAEVESSGEAIRIKLLKRWFGKKRVPLDSDVRCSRLFGLPEQVEFKSTMVKTRRFGGRKMTTYAIELRVAGRPFFVELSDSILDGRSSSDSSTLRRT